MHPKQRSVRVLGKVFPGLANPCFVSLPHDCPDPGREVLLAQLIFSSLGYNVTWTAAKEGEDFDELFTSHLANGRTDFVASFVGLSRQSKLDPNRFSSTAEVTKDRVQFLVGWGQRKAAFSALLFPRWAVTMVWLSVGSVFLLSWLGRRLWKEAFGSPNALEGARVASGILVALLFGAYANIMAIRLALPQPTEPLFETVEELAELLVSGRCTVATEERDPLDLFAFLSPSEGWHDEWMSEAAARKMRRAFRTNPPVTRKFDDMDSLLNDPNHCYIFVVWASSIDFEVAGCDLDVLELPKQRKPRYYFFDRTAFADDPVALAILTDQSAIAYYGAQVEKFYRRQSQTLDNYDNAGGH